VNAPPRNGDAAAPGGLAAKLAAQTRALHREAESAGVMRDLLAGRVTRERYVALLANLHPIYLALERGLARHVAHPAIAPIHLPGLARADALARDLAALAPGRVAPAPVPATRMYVARLDELDATWPAGLVAHAYVRYLGDLSGGRIVGERVRQALALDGGAGLAFYDFGAEFDVSGAKSRFRAALDALPLGARDVDAVVSEAVEAFRRHVAMFNELHDATQA
jgi:heme oxygenase